MSDVQHAHTADRATIVVDDDERDDDRAVEKREKQLRRELAVWASSGGISEPLESPWAS